MPLAETLTRFIEIKGKASITNVGRGHTKPPTTLLDWRDPLNLPENGSNKMKRPFWHPRWKCKQLQK